ncbi:response regulator transcription factor [Viridibacillus sp. FSL R5-0477]|uniref:Two-component response regulator n=1 Tax=Viridibacillus arenosi FSL R5-213 TaxID=1227360 RepID=W4F1Z3_9BACL|nr:MULTISPECIES: response regulator transcription factor [Viridibacillus]ETT86883.1 two-component response regulator [Viridibacillus arenosi FSL R5-213]OMC83165.1 DNA-binding response regulator [Viridibacillus sp. FSL H7-0596]OMC88178.1 DNA-binding response regulator [Viridibacillus arenosi]
MDDKFNIMIVEDEQKIAQMIEENLIKWGYDVFSIKDFQKVEEEFLSVKPHLVLLDINLPYYDGFYWCEKIRKYSNVPIVFVSSRNEKMDVMMAINMGGDDFIQKPFSMDILVTKINAIVRRTYTYLSPSLDVLKHNDLTLNLKNSTVKFGEQESELTKNEFKILTVLFENKNEIISRDELMRALWEDESFIDDNTLTVNINRLRRKLTDMGVEDYIQTKKGQGYMLI